VAEITRTLKDLAWVKKFIEYARYELQPGETQVGDQFPRQADADKAIRILDALLVSGTPGEEQVKEENDHGAGLIHQVASPLAETEPRLSIPISAEELDWVEHAARLRHLPVVEYVRRAINLSLRKEGVDALLLAQSDDDEV